MTREVEQKLSLQPSSSANPPARSQPVQQPPPAEQLPVAAIPVHQAGPSTSVQPPKPLPASSKNIGVPPRPGYGSLGQKCLVKANHFLVEVADRDVHHYDVSKHHLMKLISDFSRVMCVSLSNVYPFDVLCSRLCHSYYISF